MQIILLIITIILLLFAIIITLVSMSITDLKTEASSKASLCEAKTKSFAVVI
jgi:hypothetical protein